MHLEISWFYYQFWKIISLDIKLLVESFFCLHIDHVIPASSGLHCLWWEISFQLYLCSFLCDGSFFSGCFQEFIFIFGFWWSDYAVVQVWFSYCLSYLDLMTFLDLCGTFFLTKFGMFLYNISNKFPSLAKSPSGTPVACMLGHAVLLWGLWGSAHLSSVRLPSFLQTEGSLLSFSPLTEYFLLLPLPAVESIRRHFHFHLCTLQAPVWFLFAISTFFLFLLCSLMPNTFPFSSLNLFSFEDLNIYNS